MSLILDNVCFAYNDNAILDNISYTFPSNKVTVIVGRSGCGKSTLLNVIAKLLPYQGSIVGNDNISYVFQQPRLIENISVNDNLAIVMQGKRADNLTIVQQYLDLAGMSHLGSRLAGKLSGGEQQRVSLLRAFLSNGDLLLLDEPMQWLDIIAKQQFTKLLLQLLDKCNKTAIYVTHDLFECMSIADDIVVASSPLQLQLVHSITEDKGNRDIFAEQYNQLKKQIITLLHQDSIKVQE